MTGTGGDDDLVGVSCPMTPTGEAGDGLSPPKTGTRAVREREELEFCSAVPDARKFAGPPDGVLWHPAAGPPLLGWIYLPLSF